MLWGCISTTVQWLFTLSWQQNSCRNIQWHFRATSAAIKTTSFPGTCMHHTSVRQSKTTFCTYYKWMEEDEGLGYWPCLLSHPHERICGVFWKEKLPKYRLKSFSTWYTHCKIIFQVLWEGMVTWNKRKIFHVSGLKCFFFFFLICVQFDLKLLSRCY